MDAAVDHVCRSSFESFRRMSAEEYRSWFAVIYNSRKLQYSKYKLPTSNKPLVGTLFWKYGKHICFSIGVVNPGAVAGVACQATAWDFVHAPCGCGAGQGVVRRLSARLKRFGYARCHFRGISRLQLWWQILDSGGS
jgi:hypothetical protein